MQLQDIISAGRDYQHRWPDGSSEHYPSWVEYRARSAETEHRIRVAFGERDTFGRPRRRVLVLIDGYPHAEFVGADDFERSGDVLSQIKVPGEVGERMCLYSEEVVPERYGGLPVVGLATRTTGPGVQNAWAVVANVSDHRTMCALAALRRSERNR